LLPTVDGSEIRRENHLRLVGYPITYKVLYIPGAGFLPSTVWLSRKPNPNTMNTSPTRLARGQSLIFEAPASLLVIADPAFKTFSG